MAENDNGLLAYVEGCACGRTSFQKRIPEDIRSTRATLAPLAPIGTHIASIKGFINNQQAKL